MQQKLTFRLFAAIFFAFALTLGAAVFSFAQNNTGTGAPQQRIPPRQYIPTRNFDTQHIKLDLHFDWEREQAIGTETFSFIPLTSDLRSIELDAANMTFSSVKLANGTPLKFEADMPHE